MTVTINGTTGITTPAVDAEGNVEYTGTLTGGTGVVNIGSGQVYKDASGNVGIGTSSPRVKLDARSDAVIAAPTPLANAVASGVLAIGDSVGSVFGLQLNGGSYDTYVQARNMGAGSTAYNLLLQPLGGNLLVGTTSNPFSTNYFSKSSAAPLAANRDVNDGFCVLFSRSGSLVGNISVTTSATSYNTSSDYRLKEDWQPMTGASERVMSLKPVNFAWKVDGSRVDGFLAHEAQEVVPEAVHGVKDATEMVDITDEEGNVTGQEERPVYQGIDQSKLVPLLTAALQEALTKIDALTARIEALEATNV